MEDAPPTVLPTVVLVDDAPEVRLLVKTRLRLSGRLQVVGEGCDGLEATALAAEHRPSLMLLDVSMPRVGGLEALPDVLAASPGTKVVMYSGFDEQGLADRAVELGAAGFVQKSLPVWELPDALLAVLGLRPGTPPNQPLDDGDHGVLDEHIERFRQVFEQAAIGMATMTLSGRLVRGNAALAQLTRTEVRALVGAPYQSLVEGDDTDVREALLQATEPGADVVRVEHALSEGRRGLATFASVRDSSGRPLYLFVQVQDVTRERAAHQQLRQSEERFRLLVETVRDYAIFMLDPTGHVVSWNAGAQRSKGYAAEEIVGQHFRVFYPPDKQDARHPEHELELALRDGSYEEEGWRIRKDGTRFWANVVITAVRNESGEHIGFAKVTRDTTERRRMLEEREQAAEALAVVNAELERLNGELQQAAEDQAQFLAVTAHELRTPIGVVSGSAQTLSRHWDELGSEERRELMTAMSASATRLGRLLADLLTASRLDAQAIELNPVRFDLRELLEAAATAARGISTGAEILVEAAPGLSVLADRDRVAQAVDNLIGNALLHGVGPVRVVAESKGAEVEILVTDAGAGVPEAFQARLFERFSTSAVLQGTGLGLYIVRELARAHGGDARYERPSATRPSGAFVLVLPLEPAPQAASRA